MVSNSKKEAMKRYTQKLKDSKICIQCQKNKCDGHVRCDECNSKMLEKVKQKYSEKKFKKVEDGK